MARPRRPGRADRLDPIRWHGPARGTLLRLGAVAVLLLTAALITWSGPDTCASPPDQATVTSVRTPGAPTSASETPPTTGRTPGSGMQPGTRTRMPAGTVGVPIRLAEPTALTLVHPGDHVDLLRLGRPGTDTTAVATAALVLGVTGADDPTMGGLLLALTPAEAARAVTEPSSGFAVLIKP
ncbi:MAG: hypothetical protein QOH97_1882 [Actinoplanes sp.]|jgi:hypothetical protein|nr:hypothetical protein [Actinoplanes sp.]